MYDRITLSLSQQALCKEYNAQIKLYTIRHAMVGQLREPTPGQYACVQRFSTLVKLKTNVLASKQSQQTQITQNLKQKHGNGATGLTFSMSCYVFFDW